MKILVLDNYDSFVYNLVHIIRELGYETEVYRNDKIALDDVEKYDKILLSPGPGIPSEAGILLDLIRKYAPSKSILGVCLGHQAIAEAFGAKLTNLSHVLHGIASQNTILDTDEVLFYNTPSPFNIGHYHSWVVDESSMSKELVVTSKDQKGNVMSLRHQVYDVRGVQFHPESVLTEHGKQLLKNWLEGDPQKNNTHLQKDLAIKL